MSDGRPLNTRSPFAPHRLLLQEKIRWRRPRTRRARPNYLLRGLCVEPKEGMDWVPLLRLETVRFAGLQIQFSLIEGV